MQSRKIIIIFSMAGILAAGVIGMVFFAGLKKDPPRRPRVVPVRAVKTMTVAYRDIQSQVAGSGRLVSQSQVDVVSEVQGAILPGDIPLKKGQNFRAGAILFRVYDEQARYALLAAKSRFLNAVANLLPDFKVDYPDAYPLWASFLGTMDIKNDLPELPAIHSPKEKIFLSGRGLLSDYYSIKSEEIRLKKYTVTAPFSGAIMETILETGGTVNAGARVARIIRTDSMEVEVPLKIQDARWLLTGAEALLSDESGAAQWRGQVIRKAAFVDPANQSVSVFVAVNPNNETPLLSGVYLRVLFPGIKVENTMEIPRNAVFNTDEVFILTAGKLAKRTISIHKMDEKTLCFSGLETGTEVVTEPLVNASENQAAQSISAHQTQTAAPASQPGK